MVDSYLYREFAIDLLYGFRENASYGRTTTDPRTRTIALLDCYYSQNQL